MATYSPIFGGLPEPTAPPALSRQYFSIGRRTQIIRELYLTLLGAAAGGTALLQKSRVQANREENGGVRTIEVVDLINRATTADDILDLDGYLTNPYNPADSYTGDRARKGSTAHPAWPA